MTKPNFKRCANCHHARSDGPDCMPHWCALQRLRDPEGKLTVAMATPETYAFKLHHPAQFCVVRVKSSGFVHGRSWHFRTGEIAAHWYQACLEFSPRLL